MTKISTIVTATAIALGSFAVQQAFTYSSGPINGVTGAPGEGNCTQCHTGAAVNSGGATFTVSVLGQSITEYVPGQTYTMLIEFDNTTRITCGFELTALTSANTQGGLIVVDDPTNTQLSAQSGRQYLKHTTAGHTGQLSWQFKWTAPAAGTGPITFYAAGNSANGNGANSGDLIYTTSFTMTEGAAVAVKPAIEAGSLTAFPNPATTMSMVSFNLKHAAQASLTLYDLQGRKAVSHDLGLAAAGKHSERLEIPASIAAGTYILRLEADGKASAMRMNVL
jgi:hypothetical protein